MRHSKAPRVSEPHSGNARFDASVVELEKKASKGRILTRSQSKQLMPAKESKQ